MGLRVMACRLHKVGSGRTSPMFDALVVNKWDTTLTRLNVQTTSQIKTTTRTRMVETMAGPQKGEPV